MTGTILNRGLFTVRELLQFYRQKFLQYDSEYQELCKKIEGYQCIQQELV